MKTKIVTCGISVEYSKRNMKLGFIKLVNPDSIGIRYAKNRKELTYKFIHIKTNKQ
jgi:hypothetical protein